MSSLNIVINLEDYYVEALVVEALDNISLSIANTNLVLCSREVTDCANQALLYFSV